MVLEMHSHTRPASPCSRVATVDAIAAASRRVEGIVLTEHHFLWPDEALEEFRYHANVPESFIILAAQEVLTDAGHVLVFGADERIEPEASILTIRDDFPEGALVWAHPWRSGNIPDPDSLVDPVFDAIEILNGNQTATENLAGLKAWRLLQFTALAGSDAHEETGIGRLPTVFDFPVGSMEDLIAQVKQGSCRPLMKKSPLEHTG